MNVTLQDECQDVEELQLALLYVVLNVFTHQRPAGSKSKVNYYSFPTCPVTTRAELGAGCCFLQSPRQCFDKDNGGSAAVACGWQVLFWLTWKHLGITRRSFTVNCEAKGIIGIITAYRTWIGQILVKK